MEFQEGHLYHIYNQGNNRQKIFFERDNYLFFLRKFQTYILPYADILAYCLMPNHFHLMVRVQRIIRRNATQSRVPSSRIQKNPDSINKSIGIMLASYTRAINKRHGFTGSLFRSKTKAICLSCPDYMSIANHPDYLERQYPQTVFDYIHQNPVKAGLVKTAVDWEFSSAHNYAQKKNSELISVEITESLLEI